eukprot:RCo039603
MWGSNTNMTSKVLVKWESDKFLAPEPAIKYTYDEYGARWKQEQIQVQLRPVAIAEGANRVVYCLKDLSLPSNEQRCVAKVSKECDGRQEPFNEVSMQLKCSRFADDYNSRNPPKRVRFLRPSVMELISRPFDRTGGRPLMLVEPMLEGVYHKHSNNWGFVDPADRLTPQAFSHFTYVASGGKCIVVDIQGVDDCYTDPQIHSNQPAELAPVYGQGDMAVYGIQKFFETHRCNDICRMLGLGPKPTNLPRFQGRGGYNAFRGMPNYPTMVKNAPASAMAAAPAPAPSANLLPPRRAATPTQLPAMRAVSTPPFGGSRSGSTVTIGASPVSSFGASTTLSPSPVATPQALSSTPSSPAFSFAQGFATPAVMVAPLAQHTVPLQAFTAMPRSSSSTFLPMQPARMMAPTMPCMVVR